MALALIQKALQLALDANGTDRDALGTPLVSPVGRQHVAHPQHVVEVVHRFSLPHEDDVGQRSGFGQRVDLVQDVGCGEVAFPPLFASLTEQAVHLAAHLTRHAQRGALTVRDIDGLHELACSRRGCPVTLNREQVFDRPVLGTLFVDRSHGTDLVRLAQALAVLLGDIGHLINGLHPLFVQPLSYLLRCKSGHANSLHSRFQLCKRHSEQSLPFISHFECKGTIK